MKKNNTVHVHKIFLMGIVFLFALIAFKVVYVAAFHKADGMDLKEFAAGRDTVKNTLYAERGSIYDVTGEVLAQNVNSYTVIAFLSSSRTTDENRPMHVVDKELTALKLSEVFLKNNINSMTKEYILSLLNNKIKSCDDEGNCKETVPYQVELGPGGRGITELLKEEIEALDLPGISFIKSTKRYYKMSSFASYILGYAKKNDDGKIIGEMGIEAYYDDELKGEDGYTEYQKDAYGYQIPNTPSITEDPKSGADIYLTIDSNIQLKLENVVTELEENYELAWVTFTIADAKTGAILGSASSPDFNPNTLEIDSYLTPLTQYAYEPGSTMKIFSYMAAMENGVYDGSAKYESGKMTIGEYTIKDFNNVGWGTITFDEGFSYSSNIAVANLAKKMGGKNLKAYYKKLGFGSKTGIELPNESSGKIDFKYDIEISNAAFGQGITTTPIQNIQALTSLANNGVMLKPYIVDKIVDSDTGEVIYKGGREEIATVASPETVEKMKSLMYDVVYSNKTTAQYYQTENVVLMGKTGTAEIPSNQGGYLNGEYDYIRSFAGLFPYEDPQYIVYISVKQLVGPLRVMASMVKDVIEDVADYKNITDTESDIDKTKIITMKNYMNKETSMAEIELKQQGLDVIVIGDGKVVISQYPKKEKVILKGNKAFLVTNSDNIIMPDMLNWSRNEVESYCNIVDLICEYEGYGNVNAQSIPATTAIKKEDVLKVTLIDLYKKEEVVEENNLDEEQNDQAQNN